MNLKHLKDSELLSQTKQLVQSERETLTKVLQHLREVERRRLFSDLEYQSLFEYAVKELKYGEGPAGRRIQAMRLLKELPALEGKIESGHLSLSNISQAQSYFRETQKAAPQAKMDLDEKLKVLKSLENKSTREGQKVLISLQPQAPLPREREKVLDSTNSEMNFVKDEELNRLLEEVRSLLGPKSLSLNLAELIREMAKISIGTLKARKFGKKRSQDISHGPQSIGSGVNEGYKDSDNYESSESSAAQVFESLRDYGSARISKPSGRSPQKRAQLGESSEGGAAQAFESPTGNGSVPALLPPVTSSQQGELLPRKSGKRVSTKKVRPFLKRGSSPLRGQAAPTPAQEFFRSKNAHYIPRSIQHEVWNRDQGKCKICGTRRNLNFDHIKPVALGGISSPENLRLCCFQCNQRQAIKIFGIDRIQKSRKSTKKEPHIERPT